MKVFKKEWFEGKDCLDIGCNAGIMTIQIGSYFLVIVFIILCYDFIYYVLLYFFSSSNQIEVVMLIWIYADSLNRGGNVVNLLILFALDFFLVMGGYLFHFLYGSSVCVCFPSHSDTNSYTYLQPKSFAARAFLELTSIPVRL